MVRLWSFAIDGTYKLIYVVFNSFFTLLELENQTRCFANVAEHLNGDGTFVIEGGPTVRFIQSLTDGQHVRAKTIEVGHVGFDLLAFDQATQILYENHVYAPGDGAHFGPIAQRYTWPGERRGSG